MLVSLPFFSGKKKKLQYFEGKIQMEGRLVKWEFDGVLRGLQTL